MTAEHAGGDRETDGGCAIRVMADADIPHIMKIEERAYDFPWSPGIFHDCIRAGYCCYVMEGNDHVILAYAVMSIGAREAHILNICVAPEQRRAGCGRALMTKMIALARRLQADMMFLEVRPSNAAALRLYEKLGFNEIGTRNNYYPAKQGREDALILAKQL
jgi:ribosomal-protein-alanine N-acetyltransferase